MKRQATTPLRETQIIRKPRLTREKSMVNPQRRRGPKIEYKDFTTGISVSPAIGTETEWTTAQSIFNPLISGGGNGRIGRKTTCISVIIRYKVTTLAAAGATAPSQWRIRIFYDKQANSALPLMGQIMVPNNLNGHPSLSTGDRFLTLMDFYTDIPQGTFSEFGGVQQRKINLTTTFGDSNVGGISDIQTGSFLFSGVSSNAEAVDLFEATVRFRFTDD